MKVEAKKMLEKQLELLSKQSENCEPMELVQLTGVMLDIYSFLSDSKEFNVL